jgi:asparagine synthase (glutamine-hydrolysing)
MCGIAGLVTWAEPASAKNRLQEMVASLVHRGPDGEGTYHADGVYLGHRRLKVVDLSEAGHQPLANEDESVWISYNGEVYDSGPLREELVARGHSFRSRTDTEVVLHHYEEAGTNLFARLNGMFAFAIHDRRRKRLLLGRDRLGIKPLFYAFRGTQLVFASELKAVLTGLGGPPPLCPSALGQYLLQGFVSWPNTSYVGVNTLPPAHFLEVDLEAMRAGTYRPRPLEYWDAPFTGRDDRDPAVLRAELEELLREAVKIRRVADVPVGAFLSGGIDSSLIVGLMAAEEDDPRRVRALTIDVPGSDLSERAKAEAVAHKLKVRHEVIDCEDKSAQAYWSRLQHFDAPFNCPSLLNAWLVSRAARQHVTVALSGDGGDELFGGYRRHWGLLSPRRSLGPFRRPLRWLSARLPGDLRGRARLARAGEDSFLSYLTQRHPLPIATAERLSGASLQDWVERMSQLYHRHSADALARATYLDLKTYLVDHILAKVDNASMAVSLEVRVPLLDHRVVEFAGRVPSKLKVGRPGGKGILKDVARPYLPAEIIDQPKVGFEPPLANWLFDDECLGVLESRDALVRQVLDASQLDRLLGGVRHPTPWRVPRRSALWAIYQLERWLRG